MNRRKLIGSIAIAGLTTALPLKKSWTQPNKHPKSSAGFKPYKRFTLGTLEITIISDGHLVQKPVQPNFAPGIPTEEVNKILRDNFRSIEEIDLGMQILLIHNGGKLIMIDSGLGHQAPTTGLLLESLSSAGFTPLDITDIVITHAHPDHVGGLVDANGKLVFPNTRLHIAQIEYDFWMRATVADFSKSQLRNEPDFLKAILEGTRKTLTIIQPKLHFFKAGETLLDCIRLVAAPGHTPGLTLMNVFSGKEELLHVADLIHSDTLLFAHPEWGFSGDTDLELAAKSRRQVLQQLANNKMLTLAYHLPWPGLGHVRAKDNAFEWIPQVYSMP